MNAIKENKKKNIFKTPYMFLAPALLFYLMFWFLPVIISFVQSFISIDNHFSFENYGLMFQDPLFGKALINTLIFAFVSLILQFTIALFLAVLINRNFKGSKLFLFIMLIPMALPQSAVGILWNTGLIESGWINSFFEMIGLQGVLESLNVVSGPIIWKNVTSAESLMMIILIDTWTVTPTVMIIILAGLQNFNKEFKEAAQVFGATKFQAFKDIVIPIIKPSIITALMLRLIAGLQVWLISVMIFGFQRQPFLLERIVYYTDKVQTGVYSYKLAVAYYVFTLLVVFTVAFTFSKLTKGKDWRKA
ncbi:sugar ABC transporter permease [Mycoplasmatota bacterium]|nr:sugar ABC transporter permease [Mycoplasmatota bacterium]